MPLVKAIDSARHNIEILIFRFDQRDIERALASAVNRGVAVRALIAHLNGSGEEKLAGLRCACSRLALPWPGPPTTSSVITQS